MGQINILNEKVFNRIAAGEVIERPSSVVKELIENSIDAQATSIRITIERSGIKTISVLDNGVGMDNEDALLCFEPHATSKIRNEEDIFNIKTMGFRGEALPSIASVSRVRLRTKRGGTLEGREVIIEGGKFITERPTGCAAGSEITISDLFYNVPARKKFLKGEITEEKHIHEVVISTALAHPEIFFEFIVDGKTIFSSPSEKKLIPRIALVLGKEIADNSILIEHNEQNVRISGYVSKPGIIRNTRRDQRFFVNRRPVRSQLLYSAVREAYSTLIMSNSYPVITLFIDLEPTEIDVNVHPAKHEIKFKKEKEITQAIIKAIRNTLCESITPLLAVNSEKLPFKSLLSSANVNYIPSPEKMENIELLPKSDNNDFSFNPTEKKRDFSIKSSSATPTIKNDDFSTNYIFNENSKISLPGCGFLEITGIFDKTYIIGISDIGLIIIDQHAAHERIIFEKLLKDYSKLKLSQELLIPITVELSKTEFTFLKKYLEAFRNIGFELEFFGENTLLVTSVPNVMQLDNIPAIISDILNLLIENKDSLKKADEETVAKFACKIAVKAHDELTLIEAKKLIADLSKCDLPFSCPHGRPTVINISTEELEKRFGRKGMV